MSLAPLSSFNTFGTRTVCAVVGRVSNEKRAGAHGSIQLEGLSLGHLQLRGMASELPVPLFHAGGGVCIVLQILMHVRMFLAESPEILHATQQPAVTCDFLHYYWLPDGGVRLWASRPRGIGMGLAHFLT